MLLDPDGSVPVLMASDSTLVAIFLLAVLAGPLRDRIQEKSQFAVWKASD